MYKVLIVDDEPKIRRGIKKWVNELKNYNVVGTANDYLEAIKLAEKTNPDVFIMDINMPTLDGLELSKIMKSKYPNSYIIIISGYNEFDYAYRALKLKVFDYLLKPIPKTDLYKVLKKLEYKIKEDKNLNKKVKHDNILERDDNISAIVFRVKRYIEDNYYKKDISLNEVSRLFNINKNYLSRLMKDEIGLTFTEYLTYIRIGKAKEILTDPILNYNIAEISDKVGFKSQHYFSRVFKKEVGISPLEYKNNHIKY